MSDYLYEGTIRSPDELMAIADYRKTRIEELERDKQNLITFVDELKQRLEAVEQENKALKKKLNPGFHDVAEFYKDEEQEKGDE